MVWYAYVGVASAKGINAVYVQLNKGYVYKQGSVPWRSLYLAALQEAIEKVHSEHGESVTIYASDEQRSIIHSVYDSLDKPITTHLVITRSATIERCEVLAKGEIDRSLKTA